MARYKFLILSAFCIALLGPGCVHGDLDTCPPMVKYAVAFTYDDHQDDHDRFYDDVKKINLYVFDASNLVYTFKTQVALGGRFDDNFTIPLDLPMGVYHILAWGNVLESEPFKITPDPFVIGKTTLNEARLALQKAANGISSKKLEKLFFGSFDAEIPLYVSRIDTIPLINDTKNIRVVVHWEHDDLEEEELIDYENVELSLSGYNSLYKFDNDIITTGVTYTPYDVFIPQVTADSAISFDKAYYEILPPLPYYSADPLKFRPKDQLRTTVYDFSVLRLFPDVPLFLNIQFKELPVGKNVQRNLIPSPVDIISGTDGCQRQFFEHVMAESWRNTFDLNDHFQIDVYIYQERTYGDAFVTGELKIYNWWLVHYGGGGGAN